MLIVPLRHVTSVAELTVDESEEFSLVYEQLRHVLSMSYGRCVFFEHGIRKAGSGGCGIEHAHMHALPADGAKVLSVLQQSFSGHRVNSVTDADGVLSRGSSYLYCDGDSGERYVFEAPCIPSQYMRKLFSESLGKEQWDWRIAGYEPSLVATLRTLSSEFAVALSSSGR